ncbi:MAG: phospholipase D-like domain-containing protein [Ectothiorhodospiraceae bacterium]|jgi:cardiolipin synthase
MDPILWLGGLAVGLIATAAALHALLYKREPAAAFGWIAVCLLFPPVGPALYFLLGINRIRLRARELRSEPFPAVRDEAIEGGVKVRAEYLQQARISGAVTGIPLASGNRLEALHNGEQAYPAMLEAIEQAQDRVYLSTYIFENNRSGERFAEALGRAVNRGVDVRVLLDGAGEWYSFPRARHLLRRHGVSVARFLPPRVLPPRLLLNLRNHRKILVIDGRVAFTGGMNIGDRHLLDAEQGGKGIQDVHFRVEGPVTDQIEEVFLDDWVFTTGERRPALRSTSRPSGDAYCRAIADGPHEDLNRLTMVLVGAIAAAHRRIAVMTPYFLPPRELISALQSAAIRGLTVDVILPAQNNLPFMHWATRNMLWELVKWGVRVWYQPGPFTHTKLFVVDEHYAQIGSANLDPRSLRLNFELVVEVYDPAFSAAMGAHIESVRRESRPVTLSELDSRPMLPRLRDAICWLFTPYL